MIGADLKSRPAQGMRGRSILKAPDALKVSVVWGGPSKEAEVSMRSGVQVAEALASAGHTVRMVEYGDQVMQRVLASLPDVVFPVMHGGPGEDGTFQGALETAGLAYAGNGVLASAIAMNKPLAKLVCQSAGIPVIEGVTVRAGQPSAQQIWSLGYGDLVAKPASEGSGLGVEFCNSPEQLATVIDAAEEGSQELLVERRVCGMEVTVGVLATAEGLVTFPPIEVSTPPGSWYDFEHRYTPGLSQHTIPARLPPQVLEDLASLARMAHVAVGCEALSRSDFLVDASGNVFFLELNSLPGMTATSLFPEGANACGISFPELMDHLVALAVQRR